MTKPDLIAGADGIDAAARGLEEPDHHTPPIVGSTACEVNSTGWLFLVSVRTKSIVTL